MGALGCFLGALGSFRTVFWRPGASQASILGHFGSPKPHFLDAASCPQACNEKQAREAFRIGKTNTKHMSALQRAMQKTSKDRSFSLLNSARCQERSEMTCWSAQGSIWEGFGTSRASLGRLLGTLGALLVALGRLLDASWTHLGCSWAPLGCQVLSKMGSGSIFHRFWLHFGRAEAGFARALAVFFFIFGHGAGIAAKNPCWHSLSAFRFHIAARRYVHRTWNREKIDENLMEKTKAKK